MAFQAYLRIDGIPGESTNEQHPQGIDIESFSWGVSQTQIHDGGAGGPAHLGNRPDRPRTSRLSAASPKLFLSCAAGQHHPTAVLELERGITGGVFYRVALTEVTVSAYQTGGSEEGGTVLDQFTLAYATAEIRYVGQTPAGAAAAPVQAHWDFHHNTGG